MNADRLRKLLEMAEPLSDQQRTAARIGTAALYREMLERHVLVEAPHRASAERPEGETPPADKWMIHFVNARNVGDRGFYEHEAGIDLPADGELAPDADEFEVLLSQLTMGGLVPGFPDAIERRYSPPSAIVAQDVSQVDFTLRASRCGILFRRSEFEAAGAVPAVIAGRGDLHFDDLLGWDRHNLSAEYLPFRRPGGHLDKTIGLSLYIPRSPFTSIGVLVDSEDEAEMVSEFLTMKYLGLRQYEPAFRYIRGQLRRMFVLWDAGSKDGDAPRCTIPTMGRFRISSGVALSPVLLRHKALLNLAISEARLVALQIARARGQEVWPNHAYSTMFIDFEAGIDPMSQFLLSTNTVESVDDGVAPNRFRLDLGIDCWSSPEDQRAMFEAARDTLEAYLGLRFAVRSYV